MLSVCHKNLFETLEMRNLKRLLFFIICFVILALSSFSQSKTESEHFQDLLVKPEVSELFKSHKVGPVNANGEFQYSINLHNIECSNITVPIDLNYAGRSINPTAYTSNVGLNWSFSGEGAIKRTVKGNWDFSYMLDLPSNCPAVDPFDGYPVGEKCDRVGWLKQNTYNSSNTPTIPNMDVERKYLINNIDEEPDIFTCSAPGLYVKFIFNKNKEPKIIEGDEVKFSSVTSGLITIPANPLYVQGSLITGTNQSYQIEDFLQFEIISSDGKKYTFSNRDIIWEIRGANLSGEIYTRVANWRLTKIVDLLTNEEITYTYTLRDEDQGIGRSTNYSMEANVVSGNFVTSSISSPLSYSYSALTQWYQLSTITYKNGTVQFTYKTTTRSDRSGDYALDNIVVKNKNNTVIKKYVFITSYFLDANNQSSCLKLDQLNIQPMGNSLTSYAFGYYTSASIKIPKAVDVKATDIYGNLKSGVSSSSVLPSFYFVGSTTVKEKNLSPYQPASYQNYISGTNLLSTDEELKVGLLTQITFPLKGKLEIVYEHNAYDTYTGNGVRLQTLTHYSSAIDFASKKSYSYSTGKVRQFPQFVSGHTVYRDPINIDACNQVYYDWIEENIVDNSTGNAGSIKYSFNSVDDGSTTGSRWLSSLLNSTGASEINTLDSYFDGHYYSMATEITPIDGKLEKIEYKSNTGAVDKKIEYVYTYTKLADLNISKQSASPIAWYDGNLNENAYGAGVYYRSSTYNRYAVLNNSKTESNLDDNTSNYIVTKTRYKYLDALPFLSFEATNIIGPYDSSDVDGKFQKVQYYYPSDIMKYCTNMTILTGDSPDVKALKYMVNNGIYLPLNIKRSKLTTKHVIAQEDEVDIAHSGIENMYTSYRLEIIGGKQFVSPDKLYKENAYNRTGSDWALYYDQGADFLDFGTQDVLYNNSTGQITFYFSTMESRVIYDQYDEHGNLAQLHKYNDINKSVFWAYNHCYPVVVADNVSYSTLKTAIIAAAGTSDLESFWNSLGNLTTSTQKTIWNNFNDALRANSNLQSAFVSTYSFTPLVGMTSESDLNGVTTFYEYDSYGHFHLIKEDDGNIQNRYYYNYKQ